MLNLPVEQLQQFSQSGGLRGQLADRILSERGDYQAQLAEGKNPGVVKESQMTGRLRGPVKVEPPMPPDDPAWGDRGAWGKPMTAAASVVGTTGSMLSGLADLPPTRGLPGAEALRDLGESMQRWQDQKMPKDPTLADKIVAGFGSMASFLVPGVGVAKGTQALSVLAPVMAKWTGAGVMAGLEAASEYNETKQALLAQGEMPHEAEAKAMNVFLANLALLGVTDKIGFFNDLRIAYEKGGVQFAKDVGKKVRVAKGTEGLQEGAQRVLQNAATGKALMEGTGEAAFIGAVVGGGTAGVQAIAGTPMTKEARLAQAIEDDSTKWLHGRYPDEAAPSSEPPAPVSGAAASDSPVGDPPLSNPIAADLADIEGAGGEAVSLAGQAIEDHTPASLEFLTRTHPDQFVRQQAAEEMAQRQAAVVQSNDDPETQRLETRLRRDLRDDGVRIVSEASLPASEDSGSQEGRGGGLTRESAGVISAILGVGGQQPVFYIPGRSDTAEGVVFPVADGQRVFLSATSGAVTPLKTAGHEVFHHIEHQAPDLFNAFKGVVDRQSLIDLSTSEGVLAYAETYAPNIFDRKTVEMRRKAGHSAEEILDDLLDQYNAGSGGVPYTREMLAGEFYNDVFGNRFSEPGFYKSLIKEMARTDIDLLANFRNILDDIAQRVTGLRQRNFVADKFLRDIEPIRQEAARVYAAYASRGSYAGKVKKMTPAELLLTQKSHSDDIVRDLAEAELKRREVGGAYAQREAQKDSERQVVAEETKDDQVAQAEAVTKAAGVDAGTPGAMQSALASAKEDNRSKRSALAKEVQKAKGRARKQAKTRPAELEDNEMGRFSPKRKAPGSDIGHKRTKASYNFGTASRERIGQISWEAMPGKTTGVLPGIFSAPLEQQLEYLQAIDAALRDENGNDLIAEKLGLPILNTAFGPSAWQMNVGAGAQTTVAIATERDQKNKRLSVAAPARELLNTYAAIRGLVLNQEAVVWHFPIYEASKEEANGIQLDFGRDPTHDEALALYRAIHEISGRDDWAPAYVPGVGVRILNFSDVPNAEFHKLIDQAAQKEGVPSYVPTTFRSDGDYIGNDWVQHPDGAQYKEVIDGQESRLEARGTGRSDLQGWIEGELRPRTERVNQEFAERYGWARLSPERSGTGDEEGPGSLRAPGYGTGQPGGARPDAGSSGLGAGLQSAGTRQDPGPNRRSSVRVGQGGRVDVTGVHFSKEQRQHLSGLFFGTGIKSEEARRVFEAKDSRLRSRLYAYVDEGKGVRPEQGVGTYAHTVHLDNLYDLKADPLGVRRKTLDPNNRESLILDAGFDGYYAPGVFGDQGVAILIGGAATRGVPATRYHGGDVAPAAPVASREETAADRVEKARSLPDGQMSGADWKKLVPLVVKDADVSMLDDGRAYYKDQVAQAMRGEAKLSPGRTPTAAEKWRAIKGLWLQASENEDLYQFPKSSAETMAGVFADIDPTIKVSERDTLYPEHQRQNIAKYWVIRLPDGRDAEAYIKANGRLWVNASQLKMAHVMERQGPEAEQARLCGADLGKHDCADGRFNDTPPTAFPSRYWPEFKRAYREANTHPYAD